MDFKFSIIIPHYNIPDLLERCLKSIPQRDDIQVIVVDDCSNETSVSVLKDKLEKEYPSVQFIYQNENGGGGRCRNEALKYAKGKWLVFADADDFFSENCSFLFDKYLDSEADIVYFCVDNVNSRDTSEKAEKRLYHNIHIKKYFETGDEGLLRYLFTEPWSKMIRAEMVFSNDIRFSETKVCNDYFFSAITGFHAKKIVADEMIMYVVTQRIGSVSSSTESVPKILDRINVMMSIILYIQKEGLELPYEYQVEKIDKRMISLLKLNPIICIKQFWIIKKSGLAIFPIIKRMMLTFWNNRIGRK